MNMRRVSVLQTDSGVQMWISQSHRDLVWLHFLSPQGPRAWGPSPASAVANWSCVRGLPRRCFRSADAKNEAQVGKKRAASPVDSCFSGRLTLMGFHESRLKNTKEASRVILPAFRQEFPVLGWVSQPAGGKKDCSYVTHHLGFCWHLFSEIIVILGVIFLRKKPSFGWKVLGFFLPSLFTCRMKGILTKKVLLNKHRINVRVFLGFIILTHAESLCV